MGGEGKPETGLTGFSAGNTGRSERLPRRRLAPAEQPREIGVAGFTLVELLVVIAIMTTLMGILLPVVGRAREHARRAKCAANLKQIGQALMLYGSDYREYLPSYADWGRASTAYELDGQQVVNYAGHQGASRHRVIGYSNETASPETDLAWGAVNFMPVGAGFLVARSDLGAESFACPSMYGKAPTWFGNARYLYTSDFARKLGSAAEIPLVTGDGRELYATETSGGKKVVGVLSSYAYRNTPFYCRLQPDNAPSDWAYVQDHPDLADPSQPWIAAWTLPRTRPRRKAHFMTPPYGTIRTLGGRSLCSDGFDLQPDAGGGDFGGNGMGRYAHRDGYNVLYGAGHVEFFPDEKRVVMRWKEWADENHPGTDNLTISSMSSHNVWNLFDRTQNIDMGSD